MTPTAFEEDGQRALICQVVALATDPTLQARQSFPIGTNSCIRELGRRPHSQVQYGPRLEERPFDGLAAWPLSRARDVPSSAPLQMSAVRVLPGHRLARRR